MPPRFQLPHLPVQNLNIALYQKEFGLANRLLARYDGMTSFAAYSDVLLSPLMTQEAVLSSRIEGTQSTIDEVYSQEAGEVADELHQRDVHEILNYRAALRYGTYCLSERGITLGLMKELHAQLLASVRGQQKTPGQIRLTQNWIGSRGCTIEEATYVPPPPETVETYLENWIHTVNSDEQDPLIQVGILHAQFELIHPFLDGNGRVGRLFIPLYLCNKGVLRRPHFFISEYFEEHRNEYTGTLNALSKSADAWNEWIRFFLRAVAAQAEENIRRSSAMQKLYQMLQEDFRKVINSAFAQPLLEAVFRNPIFTKPQLLEQMKELKPASLQRMVDVLVKADFLQIKRPAAGRKPAIYQLPELTRIAEGKPIRFFDY